MSFSYGKSTAIALGAVTTLTGNSGGAVSPMAGNINIVGGTGITVVDTPGTSTLTINSSGSFAWTVITSNQTAVVNNGYICNKSGTLALLLPATASIGDTIKVTGINTGWTITQNANQEIYFGTSHTTVGVGGSLSSLNVRDSVELVCVVSGSSTIWNVISSIGNLSYV